MSSWGKKVIIGVMLTMILGCEKQETVQPQLDAQGKTMGTFYHVKVVGSYPGGQAALQQQVDALLKHYNA